jgi:restriction endonuclease S subunit
MESMAAVKTKKTPLGSYPLPPKYEQRHIVSYLDDLQAKLNSVKKLKVSQFE